MTENEPDLEALMTVDRISFGEVMECIFDIRQHEIDTYLALVSLPGSTVGELASHLERDRSTVSRTLTTLLEKNLAERERRIVDGGGYVFQYYAAPIEETQERMRDAVDVWVHEVHEKIDGFG